MVDSTHRSPLIIGIDLGTTNSLVAISDRSGTRILPDGDSRLIPSVLVYDDRGRISAVGNRAKTLKSIDPRHVLYSVKRLMGRGLKDLERLSEELPFDFSPSSEEMIRIQCGPRAYTPIELSAEILKRCKFVAENHLGSEVRRAVVTVPAYFNDAERSATILAGKLAGLDVVRILNEPTAAALAYGLDKSADQKTIAVYDFGGGTFDISILKVTGGIFEVLSTAGDTRLGGDDLDRALGLWLVQKIGDSPQTDDDRVLFSSQVEQIKISLTDSTAIHARIQWGRQIRWEGEITRKQIDEIFRPIVDRTIRCCREALRSIDLSASKIDEVILVGGSSRLPLVRATLENFFGKTPSASTNPDEVVALGAAVQGAVLAGEVEGTLLLDVVPLSLGLETVGGTVSKIIHRNSSIPATVSELFTTYADFQTAVDFHILQGEREFAKDCRSLARFKLRISQGPAGFAKLRVTFMLDANGVLKVSAKDEKEGTTASIEVRPSFGLTDAEVEKMLTDAIKNAETDFRSRLVAEAQSQALSLLRATERSLSSPLLEEDFKESQLKKLKPVMNALAADLKGKNLEVISMRTKELDLLGRDLAQHLLSRSIRFASSAS